MKKDIHPVYHPNTKITCACGNVFSIGSTKETIRTEICSACHPFFTGKKKLIDTAGRVEKFHARRTKAAGSVIRKKSVKKAAKKAKKAK